MEFSEEFTSQHGLTEDQISAVKGLYNTEVLPNLKKEWDGLANENAEGILSGAAKYGATKFGVEIEREKGEKWGDYLQRIADEGFSAKEQAIIAKETELQEKLKNFKGSDDVKQALEAEKQKNDALLAQIAELEPLKGLDKKYQEATESLTGLKKEVAYNSVKPNFPDNVNQYEADAKWGAWKKGIEEKYNIELVDNVPMAVDKENHHKVIKLADLISQDENINALLQGRQQKGTGANPIDMQEVDGVPFKVPSGATSEEQSNLVREYLVKKLGDSLHPDFAKEFMQLLTKVKNAK